MVAFGGSGEFNAAQETEGILLMWPSREILAAFAESGIFADSKTLLWVDPILDVCGRGVARGMWEGSGELVYRAMENDLWGTLLRFWWVYALGLGVLCARVPRRR